MKELSIIVPVYNVEPYIKRCVDSLLNQNCKSYEIILVDDGAKDKSPEICDEYAKKHPDLIKVIHKKNGGLSSARNCGLKEAIGKYVWFIDGDDFVENNCLRKAMKQLKANDILCFNFIDYYETHSSMVSTFDKNIKDLQKRYLVATPSACNKIIKRSLLTTNQIEFPIGLLYEDLATMPSLCQYTDKIVFIDDAYYNYYQREGSIMHQQSYNKKLEDIFESLETLKNRFSIDAKEKYKEEIEFLFIWHLLKNGSLRFLDYNKYDIINRIVSLIKEDYPEWRNNVYYKEYDIKRKLVCNLVMTKKYKILNLLRKK